MWTPTRIHAVLHKHTSTHGMGQTPPGLPGTPCRHATHSMHATHLTKPTGYHWSSQSKAGVRLNGASGKSVDMTLLEEVHARTSLQWCAAQLVLLAPLNECCSCHCPSWRVRCHIDHFSLCALRLLHGSAHTCACWLVCLSSMLLLSQPYAADVSLSTIGRDV